MTLKATDISVRFAGVNAIDHVSVALDQGEILGLIGPNGAGKTTMVNVLSGFQKPATGIVSISGQTAAGRPGDWFSRNGVVRTFQAVRLFQGHDRLRECRGRLCRARPWARGGPASCSAIARTHGPRRSCRPGERHAQLWRRAPCRHRPGPGALAEIPASRRTGRRHEHCRSRVTG
ncbi:MAG: ATP-binding cassette domain-containing protein [Rhizobium sp.]|nr:ATP-binding cassette domain-containing protein [Rhizobium sp.]MBX9459733.1 ATP-binding cassette domain-containing protein [Rhizobium sp.]